MSKEAVLVCPESAFFFVVSFYFVFRSNAQRIFWPFSIFKIASPAAQNDSFPDGETPVSPSGHK